MNKKQLEENFIYKKSGYVQTAIFVHTKILVRI